MSDTAKVGAQVNVITGGNAGVGQLYMKSSDPVADHVSNAIIIPIKIVKLSNKRDSKTYMLNLQLEQLTTLKCLREQILEQLGKSVLNFDL